MAEEKSTPGLKIEISESLLKWILIRAIPAIATVGIGIGGLSLYLETESQSNQLNNEHIQAPP